ncbi:hypothetical protein [Actinomyces minihominis]|uniref:primosomal protein N' family DNA-binding protein n=1 Tax=Actinomyces minihominis TaxID=2002838 RepID=UPI000C084657|nr:hypothetical protein [Actinomyces minihominis]
MSQPSDANPDLLEELESFPERAFAKVIVDIDAPHLDEPFDYSVPEELREAIAVGTRVQVRFGRRRTEGYVRHLSATNTFEGRLQPIIKLVTEVPVLSERLFETIDYLAVRYCVTRSQLISFVVPPRRARVEKSLADEITRARSDGLGAFAREAPEPTRSSTQLRTVATVLPSHRDAMIRQRVLAVVNEGKSVLVLAPTARTSQDFAEGLARETDLRVGHIDAEQSPDRRYRGYLRALLGDYDVVVGSRSAVWTPLPNLGSIVIWDDGDDRYREQRTPRYDALDIAVSRSHKEHLGLTSLAYARSVKSQALVETGWAQELVPTKEEVLSTVPRVAMFDSFSAEREGPTGFTRLPEAAYRMIRTGLEMGPVLVHVPAAGAVTETEDGYVRIGSDRIRDELARAFPDQRVTASSSTAGLLQRVDSEPQVVVATPGAEPVADGGYVAVIITGASGVAYRNSLDGALEAMRRWMDALALSRPRSSALLVGEVQPALLDSLVRWSPGTFAREEWQRRMELGFPPARWVVSIEGPPRSIKLELDAAARAIGAPELHLPGKPFPDLALLGQSSLTGEDGAPLEKVVLSVEARRIQALMLALGLARRSISRDGGILPRFDVNPYSLVDPAP